MYKMLINAVDPEEYRIAILKGGELDEFYIATSTREEIKGNIYKGAVSRIEPSLQAASIALPRTIVRTVSPTSPNTSHAASEKTA